MLDFSHSTSPDHRYVSPAIDDEAELQEQYNIDYHTLQSSLDPDEVSRLEIEPDYEACTRNIWLS